MRRTDDRLAASFLLASTAFFAPGAGASAPSDDPRTLLARGKEAAGGAAWDRVRSLHAVLRVEAGGLTGRSDSWEDLAGRRHADRYALGPASGASGFDGRQSWQQDSSGQVIPGESADARQSSANEAYRRSRAYWYPERWEASIESAGEQSEGNRRFHVLRITPKEGRPFDVWIDEATSLFDRIVEKGAMETRTEYLSDYRSVEGIRLPFRVRSSNGNEKYDQVLTVEKLEVNPAIADATFAMPAPPPPDFSIAGGTTSTTVPFRLVNNHIYVDAKINGRSYRLLCDTGGANIVTPAVARELGLKPEGALEGRGVGEKSQDVGLVRVDSVQIGNAVVSKQLFAVFDLGPLEPVEGAPMPGLVGFEIFKRFVVGIDYAHRRLTLTLPDAFREPASGVTWLPFQFKGRTPQVQGEIDGIAGTFDIDTGSRASLDLMTPFVEKNGLVARYDAKTEAVTGWGVGGPARGRLARAKMLKLGSVEIPDVVTTMSLQKKGAFTDVYAAGNVGAGVLRRFALTFDYGRRRIGFAPSSEPVKEGFDRSGMWINAGTGGFDVVDVTAGGPAEKAGLHAGDKIVAVDGAPASSLSLSDLRRRLRTDPPGTPVRVKLVSSGGAPEREATIVLNDLV